MSLHEELLAIWPQLSAYARALSDSPGDAEDLVQEAIARALAAPAPPAQRAELRPWMFRVIRNLRLSDLRKQKVRKEYISDPARCSDEGATAAPDPLTRMMVERSFRSLSPDHREILFLVDIQGLRYSEAARVLDIAEGTVMSRLSRARKAMLDRIEGANVAPLPTRKRSG